MSSAKPNRALGWQICQKLAALGSIPVARTTSPTSAWLLRTSRSKTQMSALKREPGAGNLSHQGRHLFSIRTIRPINHPNQHGRHRTGIRRAAGPDRHWQQQSLGHQVRLDQATVTCTVVRGGLAGLYQPQVDPRPGNLSIGLESSGTSRRACIRQPTEKAAAQHTETRPSAALHSLHTPVLDPPDPDAQSTTVNTVEKARK